MKERGFDDSFAAFCAKVFSSYLYPPENLPAARMHAHYLRLALVVLCDENKRAEILGEESGFLGVSPMERLCLKTASWAYKEALSKERPFGELFIERWCKSLSGEESD